jgi:hypothetical protein
MATFTWLMSAAALAGPQTSLVFADDCNNNGIEDVCELDCGDPGGPCDVAGCGTTPDCNDNNIPDNCDSGTPYPQPAAETCPEAMPVGPGRIYTGSTFGATDDGWASCAASADSADVWYRYTPAASGLATISLCGSDYDAAVAIFSGCPGDQTNQVGCDDDSSECGLDPVLSVNVTAGETYYIRVAGFAGNIGNHQMELTGPECMDCGTDCNENGIPDGCDIADGSSPDCNQNGRPDECETQEDCNGNGSQDICDIASGSSLDCNGNGTPDECEGSSDCNENGLLDECETGPETMLQSPMMSPIHYNSPQTFVLNDTPIAAAGDVMLTVRAVGDFGDNSQNCMNENLTVYFNGLYLGNLFSVHGRDCGDPPQEETVIVSAATFNEAINGGSNQILLAPNHRVDSNCGEANFVQVDLVYLPTGDCNRNGTLDACDIAAGHSIDIDADSLPDECEPDCNGNMIPDDHEIAQGTSFDCDGNGIPDDCEITDAEGTDCNANGIPDACDLQEGTSLDCNGNTYPDECDLNGAGGHYGLGDLILPGTAPIDLSKADFNEDGTFDLVAALPDASGGLAVFLGLSSGGFAGSPVPVGLPSAAYVVAVADFDGDTHLDIAAATPTTNGVAVFLGDGAGQFSLKGWFPTASVNPSDMVAEDLDLDGYPDLAVTDLGSTSVTILINDQAGGFLPRLMVPTNSYQARGITSTDLNEDGNPDLVVANYYLGITTLLGQGNGAFVNGGQIDMDGYAVGIKAADMNEDGHTDMIVRTTAELGLHILFGDGSGQLSPAIRLSTMTGDSNSLAVGDLDSDGHQDLVLGTNSLTYSGSAGGGGFIGGGGTPSYPSGGVQIFYGKGGGAFGNPKLFPTTAKSGAIVLGPFHTGSALDIAVATTDSAINVLYEGTAISQDCNENVIPDECEADCNGNQIADDCDISDGTSNDCNENGLPDECEDCNGNRLADSCDIADGTSNDCNTNDIPDECETDCNHNGVPDDCDIAEGTSGDCNANGLPDDCEDCNDNGLADECDIRDGGYADCNYNLRPDECDLVPEYHTFDTVADYELPSFATDVRGQDIDGDADIDLVVTLEDSPDPVLFLNSGAGIFTQVDLSLPQAQTALAAELDDLNGDGYVDLLTLDPPNNRVSVRIATSPGAYGPTVYYGVGAYPNTMIVTDVEADGDLDIVTNSYNSRSITVLINDGDGYFHDEWHNTEVYSSADLAVADLNGDLIPDIASIGRHRYYSTPTLTLLFNRARPADCNTNSIPDQCDIISGTARDVDFNGILDQCEADCNGNGLPDAHDIAQGTSSDCNANGIPDDCELTGNDCDGDGILDLCEGDSDNDGIYEPCDPDDDNDGILDDGDGSGIVGDNRCASGITTACDDNCRISPNADQTDSDGDNAGDVCDACAGTTPGYPVDDTGCPVLITGDFDHDGDVDMIDHGHLQACRSGSGMAQTEDSCLDARLDEDLDVDQADWVIFHGCFTGPGIFADRFCAGVPD